MKIKYRILSVLTVLLSCVAAALFFSSFDRRIETFYRENTRQAIFEVKKTFLQHTVKNQITRIKEARKCHYGRALRRVGEAEALLRAVPPAGRDAFPALFRELFRDSAVWTAALWNPETGGVLHDPKNMLEKEIPGEADGEDFREFAAWKMEDFHGLRAFFGIHRSAADEGVKREIAAEIHGSVFPFESYIWVNEVVNYDGGNRYAIRKIHPNLRDTEGSFLSTSTQDIKGNLPYLTELEGVKKDGSIFFTYFFKRKDCGEISEKLTYAELYKDYDWIVAMGIHIDDIFSTIREANEKSADASGRLIIFFLMSLIILLGISELVLLFFEGKIHGESRKGLEEEVNRDSLTNSLSRRAGDKMLKKSFQAFKEGKGPITALAIFDIDHFKEVNDACGHAGGDEILKQVVRTVQRSVRSTDRLCRWGGDEFLLVTEGIQPENAMMVGDHLVQAVAAQIFSASGRTVPVTLSMGIAYFRPGDKSYEDALRRADGALYRSKTGGRNQANIEL